MVLFTEPSEHHCRRYMRSTEYPSSLFLFCRAMLCLSLAYAVVRCPSVHPSVWVSVTVVYSVETSKHFFYFFHFFHRRVAIPFWFFIPNVIVIFRRRPRNWDKNRSWNSHMLCPSFRNAPIWIKTAQHIVIVFLPYGSPIILVLSAPKISRDSDGVTPCGGAKYRWGIKISRFSTKKSLSRNRYKIAP